MKEGETILWQYESVTYYMSGFLNGMVLTYSNIMCTPENRFFNMPIRGLKYTDVNKEMGIETTYTPIVGWRIKSLKNNYE